MKVKKLHNTNILDIYTADTTISISLPLVEGDISVGIPSPAEDFLALLPFFIIKVFKRLRESLVRLSLNLFFLKFGQKIKNIAYSIKITFISSNRID